MEQFKLMFECEDCKKKFHITQEQTHGSITHKREFNVNGQSIFLTYCDCPDCGRRHYVQIDNETSLRKLTEVRKMFVKLSAAKLKDKEISKKQSADFAKARKNLSNYRTNLMKKYAGESIYDDETNSNFTLRFSLC